MSATQAIESRPGGPSEITDRCQDAIERGDSVEVARSVAEVEQLRLFWTAQPACRDADLDFYLNVVLRRPEVARPHVISLRRDGRPRAILIGRLETKPLAIRLGYLHLPSPRLRTLTFIDGGVLGQISTSDGDEIMRSILRSLRAGEADLAVLEHFRVDHRLAECARRMPPRLCIERLPAAHVHYRRTIAADAPLLSSLSANERSNQRRREKRLRQDFGEIRIDCFHGEGDLDRLFRDAETVARTSYQRGLGVGFADTPEMRARLGFEAEKGTLRGHVLYADGKPCAFWIASLYRGVLSNDFMAFDPAYGKYAPGMFLALNVLEEVRQDPAAGAKPSVDFGIGEAEWKTRLANEEGHEASIAIFAPSAKGRLLNIVRTAAGATDIAARVVLRRSRLLPQIKRLWRKGFAR